MQKVLLSHDWLNKIAFLLALFLFLIVGCGGSSGGGGNGDGDDSSNIIQGLFVDSAVEGLDYQTPTQSGVTDSSGAFNYVAGETVTFSIGVLELGTTAAQDYLTPVDLVANATDETDFTVTNLSKLIQALDSDGDVSNGITISDETKTIVSDSELNFELETSEFDSDQSTQTLLKNLNDTGVFTDTEPRTLPSDEVAQANLAVSLMDSPFKHFVGEWSGMAKIVVDGESFDGGITLRVFNDGTGEVWFWDDESGYFEISSFKVIGGALHYDWPRTDDPNDPDPDCANWNFPATLASDGSLDVKGTVCGEGGGASGSLSGKLTHSD